jgi:BON domain-containing protein
MGVLRALGRAAPLVAAGLAARYYLRRQGMIGAPPSPELPWPPPTQPDPGPPPLEGTATEVPPAESAPEAPAEESDPEAEVASGGEVWIDPPIEEATEEAAVVEPEPGAVARGAATAADSAAETGPADVTVVVDDLLSGGSPDSDAGGQAPDPGSDGALAESVRVALAEQPGLLHGSLEIEVSGGRVLLRGELDSAKAIMDVERRASAVPGVRDVRSTLHLTGTPPYDA